MPFGDVDPYREPVDAGGPLIDDPLYNQNKGGGGSFPFVGGGGPGFGGGPGGGSSGGFFSQAPYSGFSGFDPLGAGRRKRMGGGMRRPAVPGSMANTGRPSPGQRPEGGWNDPTRDADDDYFDTTMGYFASGNADNLAGEALMNQLIAGKGKGMWSPYGDPRMMDEIRNYYEQQGADEEAGAVLASDLDSRGQDFYGRTLARTEARAGARNRSAREASSARMGQMQQMQALIQSLLKGKLSGDFTMDDDFRRQRWDEDARANERKSQNRALPWQIGGDIAGRAIGAAAGGGGKGGSMSRSRDSEYPRYNYMGSGRTY